MGGIFAPLLNTAMETESLDEDLDSKFVLLMSVGPDCHSGVLVCFKTSVFISKFAWDETRDAPRHTRCVRQLSCGYTELYFHLGTIHRRQYECTVRGVALTDQLFCSL